MTFAVIETGGKQYKVAAGQKIKVEKLAVEEGAKFDGVCNMQSKSSVVNKQKINA